MVLALKGKAEGGPLLLGLTEEFDSPLPPPKGIKRVITHKADTYTCLSTQGNLQGLRVQGMNGLNSSLPQRAWQCSTVSADLTQ